MTPLKKREAEEGKKKWFGQDNAGESKAGNEDKKEDHIASKRYRKAAKEALKRLKKAKDHLEQEEEVEEGLAATLAHARTLEANDELLAEVEELEEKEGDGTFSPSLSTEASGFSSGPAPGLRLRGALWPSDRGPIPPEPVDNGSDGCPSGLTLQLGTPYNDYFASYSPQSCVVGLEGHDWLGLANSADDSYMLGNAGHDSLSLDYYVERTVSAGGAGYDCIHGSDRDDIVFGQDDGDDLYGWWGSDYLSGGAGNDYIVGGRDHDELLGGLGDDVLIGGSEHDKLLGEEGSDLLIGDCSICFAGDDTIEGGPGDDEIWGGYGKDTIVPGAGMDFVHAGPGDDVVKIYDLCEVVSGEEYIGGYGYDTLITPVPVAQLSAMGVWIIGFEQIEVMPQACLSECVEGTDCSERGDCVNGTNPGEFSCDCEPPFDGDDCTECLPPFDGPECTECLPPFTGPDCTECIPPFGGPDCSECTAPFAGPTCEECEYPFFGDDCNECEAPWVGPNCDECPPGTFGPNCDRCVVGDASSCSDHGECVAQENGLAATCVCMSGFAGADCSQSVYEFSIMDNEGPDDFDLHKMPKPEDIGDRYGSSVQAVELIPEDGLCQWHQDFDIDALGEVTLSYANEALYNEWAFSVVDPTNQLVNFDDTENQSNRDRVVPISGLVAGFEATQTGRYQMRLNAGKPCSELPTPFGEVSVTVDGSMRVLYTNPSRLGLIEGLRFGVQARVYDRTQVADPTGLEDDIAPSSWLTQEVTSATIRWLKPDGSEVGPVLMYDDGLHLDEAAGDGIYGAYIVEADAIPGSWGFAVQMEGTSTSGHHYVRSGLGGLAVAPLTVTLRAPGNEGALFRAPGPNDGLRARAWIPLRPENGPDVSTDMAFLEGLAQHEIDISAELWAIRDTGSGPEEIPIAWAGGYRMPQVEQSDPDAGGHYRLTTELEFDGRWFANAGVLDLFTSGESFTLELRELSIQDVKTAAVRDFRSAIPIAIHPFALDWLENLPRDTIFDPTAPENEDMTQGASPEFVQEIKDTIAANSFPSLKGQVYLTSGWCGNPEMWVRANIVNLSTDDPAGNKVSDRLVHATDLWFTKSENHNAFQVHVGRFADELVYRLKNHPEVAEIWGFSQGGVAALIARRRWTPLDAYQPNSGITVQALAAEFYGTPFANPSRLFPIIGRNLVRFLMRCAAASPEEPLGLGRIESTLRMIGMPKRVLRTTRYNSTPV